MSTINPVSPASVAYGTAVSSGMLVASPTGSSPYATPISLTAVVHISTTLNSKLIHLFIALFPRYPLLRSKLRDCRRFKSKIWPRRRNTS